MSKFHLETLAVHAGQNPKGDPATNARNTPVYRTTAYNFRDSKHGADLYAVATKLVTSTPVPVLLSAGVQASDEVVNGVVGHGDYGFGWFGNVNVIPVSWLTLGAEYKSGIDADKVENHDYYDLHAAWFATESLTLVAAYVDTGSKSGSRLGVGDGFVLSAQYQF